eukprot:767533-Hanusia_phi.AAC.2
MSSPPLHLRTSVPIAITCGIGFGLFVTERYFSRSTRYISVTWHGVKGEREREREMMGERELEGRAGAMVGRAGGEEGRAGGGEVDTL